MTRRMHPTLALGEMRYQAKRRRTWATLKPGDRITFDLLGSRVAGEVLAHHGDRVTVDIGDGVERNVNIYSFGGIVNDWSDGRS